MDSSGTGRHRSGAGGSRGPGRRLAPTLVALLTASAGLITSVAPMSAQAAAPTAADPAGPGPATLAGAGTDAGAAKLPNSAAARKLGAHDVALLDAKKAAGAKTVTVMTATTPAQTRAVVAGLRALGGIVAKADTTLGYVRATLPTDRVLDAAALRVVEQIDLNEVIALPDPSVTSASTKTAAAAYPAPGKTTPAANPYLPTMETGAVSFTRRYPTYDGRGVTIGVLDTGVDLDHPALATTSTGARKITDWVTATDPLIDGDGSWLEMSTQVTGPSASFDGATWQLPVGTFRISRFAEAITAGADGLEGDVNRDGDTKDSFGVIYDPTTHDIRVDSDGDLNFTNNAVMRPYKEKYDVGHFGTDKPATAIAETVPFVVEYRDDVSLAPDDRPGTADFVNIGLVSDSHGSHVAGIAAANNLFGGAMDGAAPGANIVSSRACVFGPGCTTVALTEGAIDLVTNRGVDVVNISIGGLPALNDANNVRAVLYDRLIKTYGVQLVIAASNEGAGVNTIGDPGVVTSALAVASGISKNTWLSNYGAVASAAYWAHNYSSRGPREDGGFKPDIMAPGAAVSTTPLFMPDTSVPETGYKLPPGYGMLNGTSMAAPQATGAAALLLSGAVQRKVAVTPKALRQSLMSTSTFIAGLPAITQGTGLISVTKAALVLWGKPNVTNAYKVSAPVCTPLSKYLATPYKGPGLYNRCGASLNRRYQYTVVVTRTAGPAANTAHTLRWVGNDGTFSSATSVRLPLNRAVAVRVNAKVRSYGVHSAYLRIDDPKTSVVDARMMAAVVGSASVTAAPYTKAVSGSVQRVRTQSYFVTVPAGSKALVVNLSGVAAGSQVRFLATNPYGVIVDNGSSLYCYTNFSDESLCGRTNRVYADPLPGVWEFVLEARRTTPVLTNPFTLRMTTQAATVTPATQTLASVQTGTPKALSWTVKNLHAAASVTGVGGPLGSSKASTPTILQGAHNTTTVTVPAGATRLDVAIGNTSDLGADLDLDVYNAEGKAVASSADGDSEEAVSIKNPAAGTYTVVVSGYAVRASGTTYSYRDTFYAPSLGTLAVTSPRTPLATGASMTVNGTMTALTTAASGRQLVGSMNVTSAQGAILGTGTVLVTTVTPPSSE